MSMLEDSLRRLQTDHLDLWQIHEVIYDNDPDLHFAPDGAVEALTQAKQQGKVRYVGFTGHKDPDDPSQDALAPLSVRHGADAAQPVRQELSQLSRSRRAGGDASGHRADRDEIDGRRR